MTLGVVNIGSIPIKMACSADTPRRYRDKFGSDLLIDLSKISTGKEESFACIEGLAYTMACQADREMQMDINDWLDQFGPIDILNASKDILALWNTDSRQVSQPKKK